MTGEEGASTAIRSVSYERTEDRAVSETVGFVLLVGMVLFGATATVAVGSLAVGDSQNAAELQHAESAMTQFDSKASMVALGDSDRQTVRFGNMDGDLTVDETAGHMEVWHLNHTGDGHNEQIYSGSLGAVTYERSDAKVAYQGGGVWQMRNGYARMVSPPEFHYRGSTLTLPIVQVTGDATAVGSRSVRVEKDEMTRHYPTNDQNDRYDADDTQYRNPVTNGTVVVVLESEYHEAWESFFRTRTSGEILDADEVPNEIETDVNLDGDETVILELRTVGASGTFDFPHDGDKLPIRGIGDSHAIDVLEFSLQTNNLHNRWVSFYAETDEGEQFEVILDNPTQNELNDCENAEIGIEVLYRDGAGPQYYWEGSTNASTGDIEISDCDSTLEGDLMGGDELELSSDGPADRGSLDWDEDSSADTVEIVHSGGETETYEVNDGDTVTLSELVGYYFSNIGPEYDLKVDSGAGPQSNNQGFFTQMEDGSTLTIAYDGGDGYYITYLHLTENRIEVAVR
ncbi:hypothetical protein AArcSl_0304 [Halalkaliarchaeum desulfuricum]|uniref:DUF7308 domain-containing protein n=1 Tax=Halalkaliarchaeum desulfuricum TaxID=2055893 RepID=A0A343TFT7_9EURY|nr:hypothetical protein [Halalkaliarchaeum desulfuricum]AUX07959.1 hypothetical protein AArcSl_0304 [Halalkaliarchaeum desulfuricum]